LIIGNSKSFHLGAQSTFDPVCHTQAVVLFVSCVCVCDLFLFDTPGVNPLPLQLLQLDSRFFSIRTLHPRFFLGGGTPPLFYQQTKLFFPSLRRASLGSSPSPTSSSVLCHFPFVTGHRTPFQHTCCGVARVLCLCVSTVPLRRTS